MELTPMADSQPETNIFSVRIVSIDYYMAPPLPGVDICYSSFQGEKVNEVPVIRIYGSTPAGQKSCLHIHQALPYLYVPCADIPLPLTVEGDSYTHAVSLAIEKALKLRGNAAAKRQHVHGCSLVRARRFYGYHASEELFVKIYLYNPHDIARAAKLLLAGAAFDRSIQPHESHIPYLLQFLVDYSLYGMGHLHLTKLKFRNPVPASFSSKRFNCNSQPSQDSSTSSSQKAELSDNKHLKTPIWITSTVPGNWRWQIPGEYNTPSDQTTDTVKRQSSCELEGDATVDDIVNQQFKTYTSLSQARSDLKMVQSLVPIWEEFERTGLHETAVPPDPRKPPAEYVIRNLSLGLELEQKFMELCCQTEKVPSLSPLDQNERSAGSIPLSCDDRKLSDFAHANLSYKCGEHLEHLVEKDGSLSPLDMSHEDKSGSTLARGKDSPQSFLLENKLSQWTAMTKWKGTDKEALSLLKWLATSQGVEDINSDDELAREIILSPLLPSNTVDKVLEKANMDYESESQRECQDILDSVDEVVDIDCVKERVHSNYTGPSSSKRIPQVDGSGDDLFSSSNSESAESELEKRTEHAKVSELKVLHGAGKSSSSKKKLKSSSWCSLPLSSLPKEVPNFENKNVNMNDGDTRGDQDQCLLSSSVNTRSDQENCPELSVENETAPLVHFKDANSLSGCSVRDLMRKKRLLSFEVCASYGELKGDVSSYGGNLSDKQTLRECSNLVRLQNRSCQNGPNEASKVVDYGHGEQEVVKAVGLSAFDSPASAALDVVDESSGLNNMTFHEKPPIIDRIYEASADAAFANAITDQSALSQGTSFKGFSEKALDEVPPFFEHAFQGEKELHNDSRNEGEHSFHEDVVMGIPTLYRDDGSRLYLLTPATSPPSVDAVTSWLSRNEGPSDSTTVGSQSSSDNSNGGVPGPSSPPAAMPAGKTEYYSKEGNVSAQTVGLDSGARVQLPSTKSATKGKTFDNYSQDISQISGPDRKTGSTPLSQLGFRDPASVGAGQQLTIMSLEVQAESRGDLRPDPRFDAINVLTLAVLADDDHHMDIYVFLHSRTDYHPRNRDDLSGCEVLVFLEEKQLFLHFIKMISKLDPDILVGWDVQGGSIGFLAERASYLGIGLLNLMSRTPSDNKIAAGGSNKDKGLLENVPPDSLVGDSGLGEESLIEDEWGRTHASGVHIGGRIVLNLWRVMRSEIKLHMYTLEAVTEAVLRQKTPYVPHKILTRWFCSGSGRARYRCIEYLIKRTKLNIQIMNQLDLINRTSELARVFGIDFFSVLSRGSQYRVESMFLRLAHTQNYVAISPGNQQVASQPAMECLPLVMEPESGFYGDPVVVLDFQSLYPSMIIAYNLCFCTSLGKVMPSKEHTLGVASFSPDQNVLRDLKDRIFLAPNGAMYVPPKVRKGVLPRLLEEILTTRIMVKQAMKKLDSSQQVLHRIFNARQLALKLIANVTYGYTAAGFSGRMPCAELADSIVQCGRRTLENAISYVNAQKKWNAGVIYGDTDSMFVLLKGRSVKEAFRIGQEIAADISEMNPHPVTLKMEKVYHPCFLLTKKRYVGYSYESPDQVDPTFDAKGIETVRRDTCRAVSKAMEKTLRVYFEHQDISKVKTYLYRQWTRILSGRVSLQDFVFAKEVRLGSYSTRPSSSLPPAAIVASKAMRIDPRAEPRYGERIPYVVVSGEPGARLVDMVVDPLDLLALNSPFRLNGLYYIIKQIIPALQRVFGLVGADLNQWFLEMPRPTRENLGKWPFHASNPQRTRIDYYYLSRHCVLCGDLVPTLVHVCTTCSRKSDAVAVALTGKTSKLEKEMHHLASICRHCGGGDWVLESGVKCTSLACPVFYERRKVQKELQSLSTIATEAGFYPKCTVEWF